MLGADTGRSRTLLAIWDWILSIPSIVDSDKGMTSYPDKIYGIAILFHVASTTSIMSGPVFAT